MTKIYTWHDFDNDVKCIATKCKFSNFSGIYGIPRGGLCLAVALSHELNIKLITKPIKNSLIVDDVFETGLTLNNFKHIEGAMFFVLFSKKEATWWNTVNLSRKDQWIIFPWEKKSNYINDQKRYINKRS